MKTALPPTFSGPLCLGKKAVVFDIDGTLADSFQLAFSATNDVLQKNSYSVVTEEEYHYGSRFTTPIRMATHARLDREKDTEQFNAVGKKLGQEFDDLYIGLVDPAKGNAGFYPGIFELIQAIPGDVKVGALTNAAVAYAEAVLSANNVRDRFASVHGADDVAAAKPAPDGLLQCCSELGVAPEHAIYVGDSPSDGAAARAAGCMSLSVTWGANPAETLAANSDGMVSTVRQLRSLLCPDPSQQQEPHRCSAAGSQGLDTAGEARGRNSGQGAASGAEGVHTRFRSHVLLDRDGVINADVGSPGVLQLDHLQLLPGVARGIRRLKAAGCRISIVTNQNAVAKGLLQPGELAAIHTKLLRMIEEEGEAEGGERERDKEGKEEKKDEDRGKTREKEELIDAIFFASGLTELNEGAGGAGAAGAAGAGAGGFKLKPARDLAAAALELGSSPPTDAALVGDNYRDLLAGLRAGIRSLHLVTSSPYGLQAHAWLQGGPGAAELEEEMATRFVTEEERRELRALIVVHEGLGALVEWMLQRE